MAEGVCVWFTEEGVWGVRGGLGGRRGGLLFGPGGGDDGGLDGGEAALGGGPVHVIVAADAFEGGGCVGCVGCEGGVCEGRGGGVGGGVEGVVEVVEAGCKALGHGVEGTGLRVGGFVGAAWRWAGAVGGVRGLLVDGVAERGGGLVAYADSLECEDEGERHDDQHVPVHIMEGRNVLAVNSSLLPVVETTGAHDDHGSTDGPQRPETAHSSRDAVGLVFQLRVPP